MSDDGELPPPPDWTLAANAPWLEVPRAHWVRALASGRSPHALLIHGLAGLGTASLGEWVARATLCQRPGATPCGECESCRLHEAKTHPDLLRVGVREGKKQIAIDDVREMIASFVLKSHRGGRRVAVISPADALNVNGANALLKTLEEPGAGAVLVLVVERLDRLPATIASRCQRLAVPAPAADVAMQWLKARDPATDWAGPLALVGGAPIAALDLVAAGGGQIGREMADLPAALDRGDADVVALSERWAKQLPAVRLRWIENWITDRLRKAQAAPASGHTPGNTGLPREARTRHIHALYALLDETRTARAALGGSARVELLFERVLLGLADALGQLKAARPR